MAALVRDCIVCGKTFTAQRKTAKYCTSACRTRASRAAAAAPPAPVTALPVPPRREGAATIVNVSDLAGVFRPPSSSDGDGLLATTERELRDADRLNTSDGQAAMFLAQVLEVGGVGQTGSSIASLIREHRAALAKALDGAAAKQNPMQQLRQQRAARKAATSA